MSDIEDATGGRHEEEAVREWTGTVPPALEGWRLDQAVAELVPDLSRAQAQRLIRAGACRVDGRVARASDRPRAGAALVVSLLPPVTDVPPEHAPLEVLYQDGAVVALNKPPGMVVHPARGTPAGTLLNALVAHLGPRARPTFIHRLDRDTSGVIIAALCPRSHHALKAQLEAGTLRRTYWAMVWGVPSPAEGTIRAPLERDRGDKTRMAVTPGGKEAVTHYRVLRRAHTVDGPVSLVEATLETGRTHQIRVHFEWAGYPLVGEPTYRGSRGPLTPLEQTLPGQALHARQVAFSHPFSGEPVTVTAELPPHLEALPAGGALDID